MSIIDLCSEGDDSFVMSDELSGDGAGVHQRNWLRAPNSWRELLREWIGVANGLTVDSSTFPNGCAHWYVPTTMRASGEGYEPSTRVSYVTLVRGYVVRAEDWVGGIFPGRFHVEDGVPFRAVRIAVHQMGGAGVVESWRLPTWMHEGFMPELEPAVCRRLDMMWDLWVSQQDDSVRDGGEDQVDISLSGEDSTWCETLTSEASVEELVVSLFIMLF